MGSRLEENSKLMRKRIENHDFADETGEEYEASIFGGFGEYMRRKKIKLQNLDAEIRATAGDSPPIFRGVVAHVNGYTQPTLQDLHHLIVRHGGGFLQYLDGKTAATHIIASSLTPKKFEEFRRYRIVKPAWVTESIKAGRLLPWNEFRVVDEGKSQKVLKFTGGQLGSQTNTPRSGYKDQSNASWYNSQFAVTTAANNKVKSVQSHVTPSKGSRKISSAASQLPSSCGGAPFSPATVDEEIKSKTPGNKGKNQRQMNESPFRTNMDSDGEDPDELESPRKGESARIQVDPVLSNSAHKPLNMSGSQFIMPSQPEPKASQPVGDIKSRLLAQAKPRPDPHLTPRQMPESTAAELPPQSQLDAETLAALPEDIRKEILGHYNQQPITSTPPTPSPAAAPLASTSNPTPSKNPRPTPSSSPEKLEPPSAPETTGGGRTPIQLGFDSSLAPTQSHEPGSLGEPSDAIAEPNLVHEPNTLTMTPEPSETRESTPLVGQPDLTSHQLSNMDGLQDSLREWCSTFEDDGPYRDDVEAMGTYLRRVISEEEDVDKAVSVVRWLMWLVCKNPNCEPEADAMTWAKAVETLQGAVQAGLEMQGLPPADFK